jgi:hypothetical protein
VLVGHVRRPDPPGNQMAHDVGVDAHREHEVWLEPDQAKRSAQPTQVCAASHVSAADRYPTASKLVEESSFAPKRQDEDAELPAKRWNQEQPLSLGAPDGERANRTLLLPCIRVGLVALNLRRQPS